MRRSLILSLAVASLSLSGCMGALGALSGIPPAPAAVADQTRLDEQAALSIELAYQAAARLISVAVDAGLVRGDRATQIAAIDRRAYRAVLTARAAYDAGNAASYASALATARTEIAALLDQLT